MAKKEKLQLTEEQWNFINKKKLKNRNYADSLLSLWYRIEFYMKRYGYCDKTNKYFEKRLGLKPSSVKRYLDDLEKLGLIMRVRMGASERKLFAIRPKIEEKTVEDFGNKNASKTSFEPHNEPHIEPLYNKENKILNCENNLRVIVSNESLILEQEKLNQITEELKEKYPVEIVAEALRIYLFKKLEQKIYSVSKYIEGTCKNLIRNKKSRINKIHKRRKREELAELQQQKFEQMAEDKAQREENEDSLIKMFKEMAEDRAKRVTEIINLIGDYDWMNDDTLQFNLYANT